MNSSPVQFKYIGNFKINKSKYEIFEDISVEGSLINVFYKSPNDVECYTFIKSNILNIDGRNLIDKTKNAWIKFLTSPNMAKFLGIEPQLQVFEIGMWEDVIIPLKNGNNIDFKIKRMDR